MRLTYNRKNTLINACQKKETFLEIDVIIEPIIKFIAGRISYKYICVYAFLELFLPNPGITFTVN